MRNITTRDLHFLFLASLFSFSLSSCATYHTDTNAHGVLASPAPTADYAARIPSHIATSEKAVVVDPRVHVWGAYDSGGNLVRAGLCICGIRLLRGLRTSLSYKCGYT